ncbi:MAG: peptidoglycan binding protein CsiV [Pseudomonadales bacterium]|jgi:hypothetical protein|nr:peptidoglycan binding protein CsiV [Pseudomonadales bacterium]
MTPSRATLFFCISLSAAPLTLAQTSSLGVFADAPEPVQPSGISPDGRRWIEVEVTVFRAEANLSGEAANPGKLSLSYFTNPRLLATLLDGYAYPFPADQPPEPEAAPDPAQNPDFAELSNFPLFPPAAAAPRPSAPQYDFTVPAAPAQNGAFKIMDPERDPYLELTATASRFTAMNRNLDQSSDYQVLWHQVWRQPLLERNRVPAVAVQAGENVDGHTALEGSLRLSDVGAAQAHLDLNLWLSEFTQGPSSDAARWQLPTLPDILRPEQEPESQSPLPFPLTPAPAHGIERIWQLRADQNLNFDRLYYLDHPMLNVLIEARPYLVPEIPAPEVLEDF